MCLLVIGLFGVWFAAYLFYVAWNLFWLVCFGYWFACSGCGFLGWLFWVLLFGLLFKAGVAWLFLGLMVVLVCCLCLLITLRFGGCWFCFALSCGPDCVGLCLRCCLLVCAV